LSPGVEYSRGDVILVRMDFSDRSGSKVRPALVVSSDEYNTASPDVLIASITSNRNAVAHLGDHQIEHWEDANLLKPSLLQSKLATVESTVIRRKLGSLAPTDLKAFDSGLRQALSL